MKHSADATVRVLKGRTGLKYAIVLLEQIPMRSIRMRFSYTDTQFMFDFGAINDYEGGLLLQKLKRRLKRVAIVCNLSYEDLLKRSEFW
jgi:hypothetical protein